MVMWHMYIQRCIGWRLWLAYHGVTVGLNNEHCIINKS